MTASENEFKRLAVEQISRLGASEAVLGRGFESGCDGFRSL